MDQTQFQDLIAYVRERHHIDGVKPRNQPFGYTEWLIRLKHLFIGAGMMNRKNKHYTNVPDRKAFRPFYEDGLSPLQVLNIEIEEGWE